MIDSIAQFEEPHREGLPRNLADDKETGIGIDFNNLSIRKTSMICFIGNS